MATATETIALPAKREEARWQPSVKGWTARGLVLIGLLGGTLWVTAVVPGFWADRISLAVIYAIIGLSLNIVLGYVGQVSLGHHGFVGIAAFVAAYYVTEKAGCTPEAGCNMAAFTTAMVLAAASGAIAAGLLGIVALRIRGLYLALITLAYGFVAETSIFEIAFLTRGGAGMPAARPNTFDSDTQFAFLTMGFLALVIFLDWRMIRSKVGRAILSLKHSEPVAASYGINVTAYKVIAFVMSGLFAGIGGGLYAFRSENVVSNDFQFAIALLWVLMVVIGGLGNRTGVIIGSAFFALFPFLVEISSTLEHFVTDTLNRNSSYLPLVIGPALALLTLIQFPGGIAEQISPITRWLRGERFSMHPEGHGAPKEPGHKKNALLAKLGLHREEASAQEASTEEIRSDEDPAPGGQPEEPAGSAGKEKDNG
jgi:branched-chain amino acid transport system permease protein